MAVGPRRPSVSRETRLLLATVMISLSALWVLARIRFPERPATPSLVPPVLTQLARPASFNDLASTLSELESRIRPLLVLVDVGWVREGGTGAAAALRIGNDLAVTLIGEPSAAGRPANSNVVARDPGTGLALVRAPSEAGAAPTIWTPRRLQAARYLAATEVSHQRIFLRPVFVGALESIVSPMWPGSVWAAPPRTNLAAGAFLFSMDGELAGLVIERDGHAAIVPGEMVIVAAHRLQEEGGRAPGHLGVDVQPLTSAIAAAVGARTGVIVTWVDPKGPAADQIAVTDVIEAINGEAIETPEHWRARSARLAVGEAIVLRVRARDGIRNVDLTVAPIATQSNVGPLGLTMRAIPRMGVEVLHVEPVSAAARAGIQAGDVITLIDDIGAPAPAQVTRAFATASDDRPMLVAITRGASRVVLALEKR